MWLSVDLSAAWEKGRRAALAQGEWARRWPGGAGRALHKVALEELQEVMGGLVVLGDVPPSATSSGPHTSSVLPPALYFQPQFSSHWAHLAVTNPQLLASLPRSPL